MTSLRHSIDPTRVGRDLYLDAARACILEVGWRRSTLTEVARRAGVSRMTIYRTWPDMPTLLADLMTREWTEMVAEVAAARATSRRGDPAGDISRAVVALVRLVRANELFMRILEIDPELLLPYLLARRGRSQEAVLDLLAPAIREGQASDRIRREDPDLLARTVLLAAQGFVLSTQTMVDDHVAEADLADELGRLIERVLTR